tara:strand:+ start:55 stop:570 length:516 start_codon:yes stop_codon:yes gene_type:complete
MSPKDKKNLKKTASKRTSLSLKKYKESIKKLELEIGDLNNKNIRLLAEFDNYKKRNELEKTKLIKYEGMNVIKSILPIIDDLDRTLKIPQLSKDKTIFKGIKMIHEKILNTLKAMGVESYNTINEEFNIDLHEAVMTKESKLKSDTIIEEYEKGYKYYDKIVRHAKVVVSK